MKDLTVTSTELKGLAQAGKLMSTLLISMDSAHISKIDKL